MQQLIVGLVIYLAIIFLISLYVAKRVQGSSKNFILAGGTLPFFFVLFSQMEQALDGNATLGVFNLAQDFGFWSALAIPLGLGISLILAGLFFAKPLRALSIMTISDYFRIKYGQRVEFIASLLMVVSFTVLLAGNLAAIGSIIGGLFNISFVLAVLLSFTFIFIYTYAGGFISDVVTDPIQVVTFIVGILTALFLLVKNHGVALFATSGAYSLSQLAIPAQGAVINWATIIALGLGDIIAVDFVARILAARKTSSARKGCLYGGIGTIIIGSLFALFGIATSSLPGHELGIVQVLSLNFPIIVGVFVLGAIITASFSTADGALLGPAELVAKNIFHKKPRKVHGKDQLLKYTRMFTILMGVVGVFIALRIPQPGILLTLAFDIVLASLFATFVFGIYWTASRRAALVSIFVGASSRLLFFVLTPTIFGVENTLFYINNNIFTTAFDGWATIIPFILSMLTYTLIVLLEKK